MSFAAAQAYLTGTINETASRRMPDRLGRMRALLRELGEPQQRYRTIHVGGTSGKGSTATMIAAALSGAGKRCGLHTKPHLSSVTERARIDGVAIDEERFAEVLGEMMPTIEHIAYEFGRPTYYETVLALTFLYFAQEKVDAAVVEVGIGGKLDGTNVLEPVVCAITNIGLDHTDVLGLTLESIAEDKAGIAKPGVPLISDVADASPREVIERGCLLAGAPFLSVRDLVTIERRPSEPYGQAFAVRTPVARYELALPILGGFQQRNAATAILALEALPEDLRPSLQQIEDAFARLVIPGRMEFFPSHPSVIFDIAHNADKARELANSLTETFPDRRFSFVVAIGETKDAQQILEKFAKLPATFTFTSFETTGRSSIKPQRLASLAAEFGAWGRAIADPVEAFAVARRNADASDVVVVTGSTFVVSTLRDWWFSNVHPASR
ncbi:MAG TPA: Mur ligase family protein [Candidatus Acidoferrales bacterium]|nr:Mur ligase family protein [Candidatus Acidoferrales bacterium]